MESNRFRKFCVCVCVCMCARQCEYIHMCTVVSREYEWRVKVLEVVSDVTQRDEPCASSEKA